MSITCTNGSRVTFEPSLQVELQNQMKDLLGERTAADDEKLVKKKVVKKPKVEVRTLLCDFLPQL